MEVIATKIYKMWNKKILISFFYKNMIKRLEKSRCKLFTQVLDLEIKSLERALGVLRVVCHFR